MIAHLKQKIPREFPKHLQAQSAEAVEGTLWYFLFLF
jgi:hypothetical protein